MKTVALIPIKLGSKRLPGKNIKPFFDGTPMMAMIQRACLNAKNIDDARLYVNDTDTTDANGIPAHNIAVVTKYGTTKSVAQAIFDHKPPGIATYGSTTGTAKDSDGNSYSIHFTSR